MKRLALCAMILGSLAAGPALAALADGTQAPDFTAQASMGGKEFTFSLADALKKGPVVLYFYPAAFTSGCTVEAHDFADATDKFAALGATVIGVSHDKIDTLDKFSVSECRSKFAVAADPDETVIKSYDAVLWLILTSYTSLNPDKHVETTMAAVQKWHDEHK
jgi:thioredoxin-dependent peroxiredoxin